MASRMLVGYYFQDVYVNEYMSMRFYWMESFTAAERLSIRRFVVDIV